jgi:hypothetical protein
MPSQPIRETDLYAPVKQLLEAQGYEVKAEVAAADIVARRRDEDPVIVELKTAFNLTLFHQAITRQALSDSVYIAVPRRQGRAFLKSLKTNMTLCRRLGVGLITVRVKDGTAEIHLDPAPYQPRQSKPKKARLLKEFAMRVGDPNTGGSTGRKLMTAYKQDALRCIGVLSANGPTKASQVAATSGVSRARTIMADNHHGWFDRAERGVYALSPNGEKALAEFASELKQLLRTQQ